MFLQSGESSRLIDYMLYQSLEETGRIRSIIFRRLGKLIIDKTTIGDYVFKGVWKKDQFILIRNFVIFQFIRIWGYQ